MYLKKMKDVIYIYIYGTYVARTPSESACLQIACVQYTYQCLPRSNVHTHGIICYTHYYVLHLSCKVVVDSYTNNDTPGKMQSRCVVVVPNIIPYTRCTLQLLSWYYSEKYTRQVTAVQQCYPIYLYTVCTTIRLRRMYCYL